MSGNFESGRARDRRGLQLALWIAVVFLAVEVVGGILTGSLALLSDAGHMLTDVLALGLSIVAIRIGALAPSDRKTWGWYRVEILAALVNGVILLVLTVWIVIQAWQRLRTPVPLNPGGMLGVAVLGLLANAVSLWVLSPSLASLNVRAAFLHVMGDALSSLGVVAGSIVILVTGWNWVDPLLSLGIAAVIVWGSFRLCREALDVLLESAPEGAGSAEIRTALRALPHVQDVHDVHVWTITSGMHALSGHVRVRREDMARTAEILGAVKEVLRRDFGISHTTIQVEPEEWAEPICDH